MSGDYIQNAKGGYYEYDYPSINWNTATHHASSYNPSSYAAHSHEDNTNYSSLNSSSQRISHSNTSNNQNTIQTEEHRVANINATFGWNGNWIFKFSSYGTFSHHNFTTNYYGRIINDYGEKHGTYYIIQDGNGVNWVYLRYENGKTERGYLSYKRTSAEFRIHNKCHVEM